VLHGLSTENTSLDNINNNNNDNNNNSISDSVSNNLTMSEPLSHANSNYEPMVCAYVLLLMAIYWMTAALPLPVTSLIPLIAFPMFGVLSTVSF
jgi:di/tricarboxylate transporter